MYKSTFASLTVLAQAAGSWAATVTYDWEVTWVNAAPDGVSRQLIGINGQWPCPNMEASVGDHIVVNLKNSLVNETVGLHFHGINQVSTNSMDGASMVNQCPVVPGGTVKYSFVADSPGTFWYHSHNMGQYPDGLRGPFVVHDPHDPYEKKYDQDVILTISDWYHSSSRPLVEAMLAPGNTNFKPPTPDNILVNEGKGANFQLDVGKTTRLRIISFAALASAMIHFDSHAMSVIQIDSSYVQQQEASMLRIAPAQRYDVLISGTSRDAGQNYPYLVSLDGNRDYRVNPAWPHNFTGYLVTDKKLPMDREDRVAVWEPFNEGDFAPQDKQSLLGPVTKHWGLDFDFCRDVNGYPRACFNNVTYINQKTPTLYSAATLGDANTNPAVYGEVNPFVVGYGDIVEIVVNNLDAAIHPFHLHGHQFQVVERGSPGAGRSSSSGNDGSSSSAAKNLPPRRDVVSVEAHSYAVLRFRADNPGIYLFHCHVEWHVEMGLTATLIEAPEKLRGLQMPDDHLANCRAQGIPVEGNAAGNTKDPLDTTGFVTVPPTSYTGALYVSQQ